MYKILQKNTNDNKRILERKMIIEKIEEVKNLTWLNDIQIDKFLRKGFSLWEIKAGKKIKNIFTPKELIFIKK